MNIVKFQLQQGLLAIYAVIILNIFKTSYQNPCLPQELPKRQIMPKA